MLFPVEFCCLKEGEGSHHVGPCECERILDATVHMALCSKVDDTVHLLILHQLIERLEVADVHLHKPVVRSVLDILQVGEIAGICQFIDVDYLIVGIFVYKQPDNMTSDESGSPGNYYRSAITHDTKLISTNEDGVFAFGHGVTLPVLNLSC